MDVSYVRFSAPGLSGLIQKTDPDHTFDPLPLLSVPDDPALSCKQGRTVQAGADGKWFVKRIRHKSLWASIRHLFAIPRPLLFLKAAAQLEKAGVKTPRTAAALRRYRGFLPQYDYLITEDISSKVTFANHLPFDGYLIGSLTDLLVKMHTNGIIHGDANLRNLYREHSGQWGVIDLDGCRLSSTPVSKSGRRRELARLASSFIKQYPEIDAEEIPGMFARSYAEISGIDLDSPGYRKRICYLVERKKK